MGLLGLEIVKSYTEEQLQAFTIQDVYFSGYQEKHTTGKLS